MYYFVLNIYLEGKDKPQRKMWICYRPPPTAHRCTGFINLKCRWGTFQHGVLTQRQCFLSETRIFNKTVLTLVEYLTDLWMNQWEHGFEYFPGSTLSNPTKVISVHSWSPMKLPSSVWSPATYSTTPPVSISSRQSNITEIWITSCVYFDKNVSKKP